MSVLRLVVRGPVGALHFSVSVTCCCKSGFFGSVSVLHLVVNGLVRTIRFSANVTCR